MSSLLRRASCALLLTLPLSACYSVDHFAGDQSKYDGLYFGSEGAKPLEPALEDDKWRHYAILGLIPWDKDQIEFSGRRLAQVGSDSKPMNIVVESEMTFVQGLINVAVGFIPFGSLIFQTRNVEVSGWAKQ
ncbi:MAG: hypothetical protein AAF957_20615 [Planctomycetota bacterium]